MIAAALVFVGCSSDDSASTTTFPGESALTDQLNQQLAALSSLLAAQPPDVSAIQDAIAQLEATINGFDPPRRHRAPPPRRARRRRRARPTTPSTPTTAAPDDPTGAVPVPRLRESGLFAPG